MVRYIANKFFYMLVSLFILISATFFSDESHSGESSDIGEAGASGDQRTIS
ncbi:hypothetical protein HMSSN139_38260 [Paenibacillus sp. HMSSN-139]|nr:hypothetical protein HMSSN139_38260 [Paenibacillus sp. HMSSN-139]